MKMWNVLSEISSTYFVDFILYSHFWQLAVRGNIIMLLFSKVIILLAFVKEQGIIFVFIFFKPDKYHIRSAGTINHSLLRKNITLTES